MFSLLPNFGFRRLEQERLSDRVWAETNVTTRSGAQVLLDARMLGIDELNVNRRTVEHALSDKTIEIL